LEVKVASLIQPQSKLHHKEAIVQAFTWNERLHAKRYPWRVDKMTYR